MATLPVIQVVQAGVELVTENASAGGDVFPNTGNEILYMRNSSGSNTTVTIAAPGQPKNAAIASETYIVGDGQHRVAGPFPPGIFNNSSGQVAVSYSSATSFVVAVFRK